MKKSELDAIRTRDAAVLPHMIDGDKDLPWRVALIDRRRLLTELTALKSRDHCPCEDCKRARSQSDAIAKPID